MGKTGVDVGASWFDGWRAVGGTLRADSGGLQFSPHSLDRKLGSQPFEIAASDVKCVGVGKRSILKPRRHLVVRLDDCEHRFLVSQSTLLAQQVAEALDVPLCDLGG